MTPDPVRRTPASALGGFTNWLIGPPTSEVNENTRIVGAAMGVAMIAGNAIAVAWNTAFWAPTLMWAAALSAIGWFFGFIFGIPRFGPRADAGAATSDQSGKNTSKITGAVNTNLEDISDWLTKIIVGVSLVELKKVLAALGSVSQLIAKTVGGSNQVSFAYALLLYFSITGFLGSYLLTRLYLQKALGDASA